MGRAMRIGSAEPDAPIAPYSIFDSSVDRSSAAEWLYP